MTRHEKHPGASGTQRMSKVRAVHSRHYMINHHERDALILFENRQGFFAIRRRVRLVSERRKKLHHQISQWFRIFYD